MKRILCIDDNEDILDTYSAILSAEGYSVHTLTTPANIINVISEYKPDLLLLDIKMPDFNGLEICKEIKSYVETRNLPVIMVSSDESIHSAMCDFGATDIINKPFGIATLTNKVNLYLAEKLSA